MADIRINALATTASSTSSDDYVAVDGTTNGTRKLDAFNPTFGGNVTVKGALLSHQTATLNLAYEGSSLSQLVAYGADASTYGRANIVLRKAGTGVGAVTALSLTSTDATTAGNITVSGGTIGTAASTNLTLNGGSSGASLVLGQGATGVATLNRGLRIADVSQFVGSGTFPTTGTGVEVGSSGSSYGFAYAYNRTGAASVPLALQHVGGNVLIGTTTDGGQKLQVAGTANITGSTTGAGLILSANTALFSTDASLSSYSTTNGVYLNGHAAGWLRLSGSGGGGANIQLNGGTGASASITFGTNNSTTALTLTSAQQVQVNASTASTSTTTGALVVSGGVGVAGAIFAGGNIQSNAVFAANATTLYLRPNGVSVASGQAFIDTSGNTTLAGNLYVGGTGASTFAGDVTSGTLVARMGKGVANYAEFSNYQVFGTNSYALLQNAAGATFLNANVGQSISLRIYNNDALVVTSSSNVSIGNVTNVPVKLSVGGTGASLGIYSQPNTSAGSPLGAQIYLGDYNFENANYYNAASGIGATFNATSAVASDLAFYAYRGVTNSRTEIARFVSNTGNGLFGTTTDSGNGKLQLATHTTSAGGIGFGTDTSFYRTASGNLAVYGTATDSRINFSHSTSTAGKGFDIQLDTLKDAYVWQRENRNLYFGTNNTTALTLDSSQRCILAGALRLNNAYTAGAPTATGYVTIQDSAGNTYKVLVGT